MNKIALFLFLFVFQLSSFAQNQAVYTSANPMPLFNHGSFQSYIQSKLIYPEKATTDKLEGKVVIGYIVEIDGKVSDVKVVKSSNPVLDQAALNCFDSLPKFTPGFIDEKPVRVQLYEVVRFSPLSNLKVPPPPMHETKETVDPSKPSFPGGKHELYSFISVTITYPADALKKGIEGNVLLEFTVEEDGSITNINVIKSGGNGFDEEAISLVKKMPKWIPAKQEGKTISAKHQLPISFTIGN